VSELPRLIRRNAVAGGVLLLLILSAFLTANQQAHLRYTKSKPEWRAYEFATPGS
jgi:hypothetical protein